MIDRRGGDAEVAAAVAAGEEAAFRSVIREHGPLVLGVARRVVRDRHLAEEVAQDTFLALWRRPEAFEWQRGSLAAWLCTIARNKAVDAVRKQERSARGRVPLELQPDVELTNDPIDDRHTVLRAMAGLTHIQKEALFLAYFQGFTYREVAAELGIPEGTAKTRLRDALARLKPMMIQPFAGSS